MTLSPQRQKFVSEYLVDFNAKHAAIRAGYSERTSQAQGSRLLTYAEVQEGISKALQDQQKRTAITADRVLAELGKIAFANVSDYVNTTAEGGRTIGEANLENCTRDQLAALSEISLDATGGLKIKAGDKVRALEKIGQHFGMWTNKVEVTGKDGGPIETTDIPASERLKGYISRVAPAEGDDEISG